MTHFFEKRDLWGHRLSLWLIVLMAFLAPVCWLSVRQLRIENSVEHGLSETDPEVRSDRWAQELFSIEERILLTWDGSSINDQRIGKLVEQLVGKADSHGIKRGGLPYVSSVIEPRQMLELMQENGIEPQEAARRLEGTILGAGPLRLRLTETGRSALKKTKRELQSAMRIHFGKELLILDASPDLTPMITIPAPGNTPESPLEPGAPAILSAEGKLVDFPNLEHDIQVSWKGMRVGSEQTLEMARWLCEYIPQRGEGQPLVEESFFAIGSPVALAIGISEAGLADKAETVAAIRAASKLAGIPGESLHLTGDVVSSSVLSQDVLKAAWDTSFPLIRIHHRSVLLASMLVSTLLAFVCIRNLRIATLVLIVSVSATLGTMALVPATGGTMTMVLIVLPTLLIVLTMTVAIHFTNYLRHTDRQAEAIVDALRTSWLPCFLASLCTSIGLISLCTSSLAPVRDFGIYAAFGAMLSLVTVVYGLPALMQFWSGPRPARPDLNQSGWRSFGKILTIHSGLQSLAVIAICLGLSFGLMKFRTEARVIRDFADKTRIAQDFWYLETNLAGVMPVEAIVRFDEQSQKDTNFLDRIELVRQLQDRMRAHPEISGSVSLADFQPLSEQPTEDAGFLQKSKHNKKATIIQQRVRDGEIANGRSYYAISEKGHDLWESGDHQLNQPGDELWRITLQVNGMSEADFTKVLTELHDITRDVLKLQPGSQHTVVGTVPLLVRSEQALMKSLTSSFALTSALIFVVLIIMLRNIGAAAIAMVPNLLAIAVVLGVYSWMQQRIGIGSIMTASIGLGISASGTLHLLKWFQRAMEKGKTRQEALIDALVHCGPTLWQTSAIIGLGLLVLVPAELRLISRFGGLLAGMACASFLGQILLLPQLVAGPLGWLFEPAKRPEVSPVKLE